MKVTININATLAGALSLAFSYANAQLPTYPEVGKQIPSFSLKSYSGEKGSSVTQDYFKGKYYILDFWNTGCLSCIASFPKMDSLQEKFADKNLKIVLVGLEEKNRSISDFYKIYQKRFNLKLSAAFDSTTVQNFVPVGFPHLIWVDPNGTVKAITSSEDVTEDKIAKFVRGEDFDFYDRGYHAIKIAKANFDKNNPLLINGNGGNDTSYLFRSLISFWEKGKGAPAGVNVAPKKMGSKGSYQLIGANITGLYLLAFWGYYTESPDVYITPQFSSKALEIINQRFRQNRRFNYSIEMPVSLANTKSMMKIMQNDLSALFGLEAKIVHKNMPCYLFVVTDPKKVSRYIGNSGPYELQYGVDYIIQKFKNAPAEEVMKTIRQNILYPKGIITYNETGLKDNLTMNLKIDNLNDIESVRKSLQKIGLDLKPTEKLMRVLEIDKPRTENVTVN